MEGKIIFYDVTSLLCWGYNWNDLKVDIKGLNDGIVVDSLCENRGHLKVKLETYNVSSSAINLPKNRQNFLATIFSFIKEQEDVASIKSLVNY